MAEVEGELESSEDELGDAFEALLVDADDEDEEDQPTNSYFTSIKSLFTASDIQAPNIQTPEPLIITANSLVDDLTKLSFMH
jgi:hypothetical protein